MKRAVSILLCVLFALVILLPFGNIVSACFGYTFELVNECAFAVITAFISVIAVILSLILKDPVENKVINVLLSLLAPMSLISAVFYMIIIQTVFVSLFITAVCCCYLTVKHGKPPALKVVSLVLFVLMIVPVLRLSVIALIFGDLGQTTVVRSVNSPNGAYYAEVLARDLGAIGGNTFVDICKSKEIDAIIFKISKKPQIVYYGKWGEFANMDIYWKDDNCLVINDVEYPVNTAD